MRYHLPFLVFLLIAAPLYAQQAPGAADQTARYTVEAGLAGVEEPLFDHPIFRALMRDPRVKSLEGEENEGDRMRLKAVFAFESGEAFRTWYALETSQALLTQLREASRFGYRTQFAMVRL